MAGNSLAHQGIGSCDLLMGSPRGCDVTASTGKCPSLGDLQWYSEGLQREEALSGPQGHGSARSWKVGWGNGVTPSAPQRQRVPTLHPVLPCHQSQDPLAELQGVPSSGFLLFPCVGHDLEDNRTLFMTVTCIFF